MRNIFLLLLINLSAPLLLQAQGTMPTNKQRAAISSLIADYSNARENKDTVLLKRILTKDIDQLVSTGEWRSGIDAAIQGMLRSSASSPGKRTLNVEKIRMVDLNCALVDCHYEIQNSDGTIRKMWSTFVVVFNNKVWKIAAIRNMLPAEQ